MAALANATAGAFLSSRAFWGPVTATLDWCEVSPNPVQLGPDPDPNTLLIAGDLLGKLPVLEICRRDGKHVL